MNNYELYHHGILGQKWGVRRYQNKDGTLTEAGRKKYNKDAKYYKKEITRNTVGGVIGGTALAGIQGWLGLAVGGLPGAAIGIGLSAVEAAAVTSRANKIPKSMLQLTMQEIDKYDYADKGKTVSHSVIDNNHELYHHGILGQKWGIRRYQNKDGTLTKAGVKRYLDDKYGKSVIAKIDNKFQFSEDYTSNFLKAGKPDQKMLDNLTSATKYRKTIESKLSKLYEEADRANNVDSEKLDSVVKKIEDCNKKEYVPALKLENKASEAIAKQILGPIYDMPYETFKYSYHDESSKLIEGKDTITYGKEIAESVKSYISMMYQEPQLQHSQHELCHHGILGQKWGVRRYQNSDGSLTAEGKKRYLRADGSFTRSGERKFTKYDEETGRRTLTSRGQKLFEQDGQLTELGQLRYKTIATTVPEMTDGQKYIYAQDLDKYTLASSSLSNSDLNNVNNRLNTAKTIETSLPKDPTMTTEREELAREAALAARKEKHKNERIDKYNDAVGKANSSIISDTIVSIGKNMLYDLGITSGVESRKVTSKLNAKEDEAALDRKLQKKQAKLDSKLQKKYGTGSAQTGNSNKAGSSGNNKRNVKMKARRYI